MSKLDELIQYHAEAVSEMERRSALLNKEQGRIARYYRGKFVHEYTKDGSVWHDILEAGHRELAKHSLYYDEDRKDKYTAYQDGVMYEANDYKCGICGGRPVNDISIGFAPRYAVCAKHEDFLFLMPNIFKETI